MKVRRTAVRLLLVCCVFLGASCSWLQNEFFSLDRAAPAPEPQASVTDLPW